MNYKLLTVCALMTSLVVSAQPAGIRVEVAEQESDNAEYSIFTYKDSNADSSFGYYLSVGRTKKFLGADEILGMEVKNLHEVTVWLGATTDEALTSIASLLALYKKEAGFTTELQGRAATNGSQLGAPVTVTCLVEKKLLGGKRLQFFFPEGKHSSHAYLSKTVLKQLRMNFKIDIKLHPKQHRKK